LSNNTTQSFYKWQDDEGVWHYSDQPQEDQEVETVTVNTNANLIQGLRIEDEEGKEVLERKPESKSEASSIPLPMTVPLEKVSKMLEDVSNMQQVMDDRKKQIDRAASGR